MSVICDKCGEELMGAVNRCWKCGTQFQRIEGAPIPPIRRAPVLASYVRPAAPQVETADDEVYEALVEEEDSQPQETQATSRLTALLNPQQAFDPQKLDYASLGTSALAVIASLVGLYSSLAAPFCLAASVLSVHQLTHRQSMVRWISFALGAVALIVALFCTISAIYFWWTGRGLYLDLMGPKR